MTEPKGEILERSFTVAEVARAWRKRPQFVRDEIHAGRLIAYRIGIELRVYQRDVEAYLKANANRGPDPIRATRRARHGACEQDVGGAVSGKTSHGRCKVCAKVGELWPLDEPSFIRGDLLQPGTLLCEECFGWLRLKESEPNDD